MVFPPGKIIENKCFYTWLDQYGICHSVVKDDATVELADAVENKEDVKTLAGDNIPPILVDIRKIKKMSEEAREYFAMKNRKAGVSAIALVIKSKTSKVVGNIYLSIHKPTVPTKLFNDKEEAVKWLVQNFTAANN